MKQVTPHRNSPSVLATDLDGTLIPLSESSENVVDLLTLKNLLQSSNSELVFVTGRHPSIVYEAIEEHQLPIPDWIICDVGTTLLHKQTETDFQVVEAYRKDLQRIIQKMPLDDLTKMLSDISALRLQEPDKQGEFKLSFYCDDDQVSELTHTIENRLQEQAAPYSVIGSIDPFTKDGLIDLLPQDVSKAHALRWWSQQTEREFTEIIFAGDSGNDLAALTAGYQAILVGNAHPDVVQQAVKMHQERQTSDRLYHADKPATSGVLEGCVHFQLFESNE